MRKFTKVVLATAAVALVGASLAGCTAPTDSATSTKHYTQAQVNEYTKEATFHEESFSCTVDKLGLTDTVIHAAPIYGPGSPAKTADAKRTLTDGISNALILKATTVPGYSNDLGDALCHDPYTALALGNTVGGFIVPGTHTRVFDLEHNAPLKLADIKLSKINNVARTLVFEKGDNLDSYAVRNAKFQRYVAVLISIIEQMTPGGIQSPWSTYNLHTTGADAGIPDVIVNSKQENLKALTFAWTLKGQCLPAQYFGVNLTDQRPEKFNPKDYQSICTPPTKTTVCVQPPKPGSTYTWVPSECKWVPPHTVCIPADHPKPGKTYKWVPSECRWVVDSKDGSLIPTDQNGSSKLGPDQLQNGTTPGSGVSGTIGTSGNNTGDHGPAVPVQGASPSPSPSPSTPPATVIPQAPPTDAPGTGSTDPDSHS